MSTGRVRGDRRGLTLIEMVLTLTILALAGALIAGSLSGALRTWRVGYAAGREELVARIALGRIAEQLRSAVPALTRRGNEDAVAFDAGEDFLRFVTVQSAAGAPPAQVSYSVSEEEGRRVLVYREYPWPDKQFFETGRPHREEVVAEISGLRVTVAGCPALEPGEPGEGAAPWQATDLCLPATVGVELVVKTAGADETPYRITVPLTVVSAE